MRNRIETQGGNTLMKGDILLQHQLSLDSHTSLSCQLGQAIRSMIEDGELEPGDMIPTEEAFCNAYGISRSTVRQALQELVCDGLLARVRGKGTFVQGPKLRRKMENVYSFTHEMTASGLQPSSRILAFQKTRPGKEVAKALFGNGDSKEEVFVIIRSRLANGVPLLLETAYIPVCKIPGLTEEKLQGGSLYDVLRDEADITPLYAEESYESCLIEKGTCELLNCPYGTTGFLIQRLAYDKNDCIYEMTRSVMRGDRSKLVVTLKQGDYSVKRCMNEPVND